MQKSYWAEGHWNICSQPFCPGFERGKSPERLKTSQSPAWRKLAQKVQLCLWDLINFNCQTWTNTLYFGLTPLVLFLTREAHGGSLSVVSVMKVERKRGRINPSRSPWLIRHSPWMGTNESSITSKGKLTPVEQIIKKFRSKRQPPTSRSDCNSHSVLRREMKPYACLLSCHLLWGCHCQKEALGELSLQTGVVCCLFGGFFPQGLSFSLAFFTQTLPEGDKPTSADLIFDAWVIANSFLSQQ